MVLRRMFGPKMGRGNREMERTVLRGALCSLFLTKYYLGDQMTKNEMVMACSTYGGGGRRGAYRVLVGKPEGRKPLERLRHRCEDYIEVDF
jgi:hypothetical protein